MDPARSVFECDDGFKPALQCKSGALVERWSLPPTPCDAFAQVAQDDLSFLPFGCDDVDFPNRHSHADLRLQCDHIHVRHPTGSCSGHAPSSSTPANLASPSDLQDLQFASQDGAVQPQLMPVSSTFSTVLPFCPFEHTAPVAFSDSPSVYPNPPLSEQKAPAGPASSSDPVTSPLPQPVRKALGLQRLRPRTTSEKELQAHEDEEFLHAELCSRNRRCKHHNPWTLEETLTLIRGVEDCGGGKWADIKKRKYKSIENRSAVDLKDKWRNLMRVAVRPAAALRTKCAKRRELPLELLVQVRTLNAMHSKAKASSNAAHSDSAGCSRSRARRSQAA
ncbi:hypothetical protein WJX79_010707 [Trebouxia sp. C0005]